MPRNTSFFTNQLQKSPKFSLASLAIKLFPLEFSELQNLATIEETERAKQRQKEAKKTKEGGKREKKERRKMRVFVELRFRKPKLTRGARRAEGGARSENFGEFSTSESTFTKHVPNSWNSERFKIPPSKQNNLQNGFPGELGA